MLSILGWILFVLVFSFLCSLAEAAFSSVSIRRVRRFANEGKPGAKSLLWVKENIDKGINLILLINTAVNVFGSVQVGSIATAHGCEGTVSTVLMVLVILLGEIVPKTLGLRFNEGVSLRSGWLLKFLISALGFILFLCNMITSWIMKGKEDLPEEEDIHALLKEVEEQEIKNSRGVIIPKLLFGMAGKIFDLDDQPLSKHMTPRTAVTYFESTQTLKEVKETLLSSPHSRIPVVGKTVDDTLGAVLRCELLVALVQGKGDHEVGEFVRKVLHFPESAMASTVLPEFLGALKSQKDSEKSMKHLAIVVDEYGGFEGVITLEDLLEIVLGEVTDETDKVTDLALDAKKKVNCKIS